MKHALISGANYEATNTVVDNGGNTTVYTFTGFTSSGTAALPTTQALTQVTHSQGSSTLLTTDVYCYNAVFSSCSFTAAPTATVTLPVTSVVAMHQISGMSNTSATETHYDAFGNVTYSAQYDFGGTSPVRAITTTYGTWSGSACVAIGSNINNKPCDVVTTQNGNTVAESRFAYDSYGNLLTTYVWTGSAWLSNSTANTYNSNGTISASYDLANNKTSYYYQSSSYTSCGSCTNYPFPTSISKGGLTTYSTWNGVGGVKLTYKDRSGNTTTYGYQSSLGTADPYWRVMSVTDPLGNEAWTTYPFGASPDSANSSFTFNSGSSINNKTLTTDGYGRTINAQTQQSPSSTNYDTASTQYIWTGNYREVDTTQPCSTGLGSSCTGVGVFVHHSEFDPLGRLYQKTTSSHQTVTNTFAQNDVLTVLSPAPSGENNKQVQNQYDGLGRVTSSCQISSTASGNVSCAQNTGSSNGILTTIAYTSAAGSQSVTSTRGSQSRSKKVDGLGRVTNTITPEGGTWKYYYDTGTFSSCPTGYRGAAGQLAAVTDPNGNVLCYAYDSLNRVTGVNANGTTCRHFYYDNSTGYSGTLPSGVTTPTNSLGRMVEAATDACSSNTLITDEWFSYDKVGNQTDMWELTPNSGVYYHSTATFNGNRSIATVTLANPSLYTVTYGIDGEGRWNTIQNGSASVVNATTYNAASQPTIIGLGAGTDNDTYTYDSNNGLMTGWDFTVNAVSETGTPTWNPNGTMQQLAITDGFNAGGTQTCSFNSTLVAGTGYDDLGRLVGSSCGPSGSIWNQADIYDQYDNLTKSSTGFVGWNPTYSASTNQYGCTTAMGFTYNCSSDSNGNVTNDGTNAYTWNEFSKLASVNSVGTMCEGGGECPVYDAFGRVVEVDSGSEGAEHCSMHGGCEIEYRPVHSHIWYTQLGKTAYMNGATYNYAYWPTPGGGTLLNTEAGGNFYMHKDWLGSARIISGVPASGNGTVTADQAFAPYGEKYNVYGSTDQNQTNFTGLTQDVFAGMYDTPNRELQGSQQGRWLSPDPAGSGWNQYAYVTNPNSQIDPTGLKCTAPGGLGSNYGICLGDQGTETNGVPTTYELGGQGFGNIITLSGGYFGQTSTGGTVGADAGSSQGQPCFCADDLTLPGGGGTADLPSWFFVDPQMPDGYATDTASGLDGVPGLVGQMTSGTTTDLGIAFEVEAVALGAYGVGSIALAGIQTTAGVASTGGAVYVFWSGDGMEAAATAWAQANGGITLAMTSWGAAAQAVEDVYGAGSAEAQAAWESASAAFAEAASGTVQVFSSAPFSNFENVWYNTELPILANNPAVTGLTLHISVGP